MIANSLFVDGLIENNIDKLLAALRVICITIQQRDAGWLGSKNERVILFPNLRKPLMDLKVCRTGLLPMLNLSVRDMKV